MFESWLETTWLSLLLVIISAVAIYAAVIVLTRLAGLRSFSKLSSFDFAMTVAIGSLIAMTLAAEDPPLLQGMVALAAIYGLQKSVALLRRNEWVSRWIDNDPVLLMHNGEVLEENMRRANVTDGDLRSKLRAANVTRREQVHAVVLETTGDISVLHGDPDEEPLEEWMLEGVRDSQSQRNLATQVGSSPTPA